LSPAPVLSRVLVSGIKHCLMGDYE